MFLWSSVHERQALVYIAWIQLLESVSGILVLGSPKAWLGTWRNSWEVLRKCWLMLLPALGNKRKKQNKSEDAPDLWSKEFVSKQDFKGNLKLQNCSLTEHAASLTLVWGNTPLRLRRLTSFCATEHIDWCNSSIHHIALEKGYKCLFAAFWVDVGRFSEA